MKAPSDGGYLGIDLGERGPALRTLQWLISLAVGLVVAGATTDQALHWLSSALGGTASAVAAPALGVLTASLVALLLAPRYRWSLVPTLVVACLLFLVVVPVLYGGLETYSQAAHWRTLMTGSVLGALLGLGLAALARPGNSARSTAARMGAGWLSMAALCVLVGALSGASKARSLDEKRVDLSERVLPAVEQWLGDYVLTIEPEVQWHTPTDSELEGDGPHPGTDGEMVRPRGAIGVVIHGTSRRGTITPETALARGVDVSVTVILALPEPVTEEGLTAEVLESAGLRLELAREFKAVPGRQGTFVAEQNGVRIAAYPVRSASLGSSSNYWSPGWEWVRLHCVNFRTSYVPGP